MKTVFLTISILLVSLGFSSAAEKKSETAELDRLLQERKGLHVSYAELKQKKSNFWGTQSKQDLKKIINTLNAIIAKDDEIVREVRKIYLKKQMELKKENVVSRSDMSLKERNLTDLVHELNRESGAMQHQFTIKAKENESLMKEIERIKKENLGLERVLGGALILILLLGILYLRQRRKLSLALATAPGISGSSR